MTYSKTHRETDIIQWAQDRGLFTKATAKTQALKTLEEVHELLTAVEDGDIAGTVDAIGDVYVTLVIQAAMNGLTMATCIDSAWDEIKDRKGKMVDGYFVKE